MVGQHNGLAQPRTLAFHGFVDRLVLWLKPCGKRKEVPDAVRKLKLNFFWKNWSLQRRLSEFHRGDLLRR